MSFSDQLVHDKQRISIEARNIECIVNAIRDHGDHCTGETVEVRLAPTDWFELGWDEVMETPIVHSDDVQPGTFQVMCGRKLKHFQGVPFAVPFGAVD
jgi:hypothetical protein